MASLLPNGKQQFSSAAGVMAGGKVYTYDTGTLVPRATFSDAAGLVPNTNPVILDARGEAVIFWAGVYKVELRDSAGNSIWTVDGVFDAGSSLATTLAASGGSALIGYLEAGTGAVPMTVQGALHGTFIDVKRFGAVGDGVTDDTAALTLAFAVAGAGTKTIYFPKGTYYTGRIFPKSNTTVWMDGGVTILKKVDGTQLFRFTNVDNVHFHCNGAILDGETSADSNSSSTIYFESARKCSLRDANVAGAGVNGAGLGRDCVYIGEGAFGPSEDIHVVGGSAARSKRNGVSVASAKRTLIERVEIYDTSGSPGAGIDVEANFFNDVEQTTIWKCDIHGNAFYGIVVVFADKTKIIDNELHENGSDGIGSAAGGTEFDTGVYRSQVDVRGVAAFDIATGRITVGGGDLSQVPVGCLVSFTVTGAGAIPATFQVQTMWVVAAHVLGSTTDIILGNAVDYDLKTVLSDAGAGAMSQDPAVSEVRLRCYVPGQCSDLDIIGNYLWGNGGSEIRLAQVVGLRIEKNQVNYGGGTTQPISVTYSRDVTLRDNRVMATQSAQTGINLGVCTEVKSEGNHVEGFTVRGYNVSSCSYFVSNKDRIINCQADSFRITTGVGPRILDMLCRNDENTPNTNGIIAIAPIPAQGIIERAVCRNAGTTNATSINGVSTWKVLDSIVYDGTYYGEGSNAAYDPGNLADGAGETSGAVTVTGAQLGDQVSVSFNKDLQGITLTGWVSAAGSCKARFQNETGGAIDLAAGILAFKIRR